MQGYSLIKFNNVFYHYHKIRSTMHLNGTFLFLTYEADFHPRLRTLSLFVVYFDQRTGAPHAVCWLKSIFNFSHQCKKYIPYIKMLLQLDTCKTVAFL